MLALLAFAAVMTFGRDASADLTATDHLKCYKVKDSAEKAQYTVDLNPTFSGYPTDSGCTVKVPAKLLCNVVSKENLSPPAPNPTAPFGQSLNQLFVCYKLKCPKVDIAHGVDDQFGSRMTTLKSTKLLCAPAWGPQDLPM
jgi:hypothetical protein